MNINLKYDRKPLPSPALFRYDHRIAQALNTLPAPLHEIRRSILRRLSLRMAKEASPRS